MHYGMNRRGEDGHAKEKVAEEGGRRAAPEGDVVPGVEYGLIDAGHETEDKGEEKTRGEVEKKVEVGPCQ